MVSSITIRRMAWHRIALVSVVLAVMFGLVQYFYQMELVDEHVVGQATSEGDLALSVLRLVHHKELPSDAALLQDRLSLLQRHFSIIELYDENHDKQLENVPADSAWLETMLKQFPDHGFGQDDQSFYRRLLIGDTWFWQVVAPLTNEKGMTEGYFEGVYHLDADAESDLRYGVLFSVCMVVLATLITGLVMYPLLIKLTRDLELQSQTVAQLSDEMSSVKSTLGQQQEQAAKLMGELSTIIHHQFDLWKLSDAEKEVALLLLKGLSLEEIAQLRGRAEKTIRQQASSVYSKAGGLSGRHALSAYFFEDLLGGSR